jgi:hypothetical protein
LNVGWLPFCCSSCVCVEEIMPQLGIDDNNGGSLSAYDLTPRVQLLLSQ